MCASFVKSTLAATGYSIGLLELYARLHLCDKAFVLMYHRILPTRNIKSSVIPLQPGMYVSAETFRRQVEFLRSRFTIISLSKLLIGLQNGEDLGNCCALTFDDGWLDNYQYAFPVLQEHGVPATIFLATGNIGSNRWFWPEEVAFCMARLYMGELNIDVVSPSARELMWKSGLATRVPLVTFVDNFISLLKEQMPAERKRLVEQLILACQLGSKRNRLFVSWEEVREMADSALISFGAHTVNHTLLDQLIAKQVREEVVASKERIEAETALACTLFAYPNGNYNNTVLEILRNEGILAAVTTKRGYVGQSVQPLEIPRIGVHEDVSYNLPLFYWRLLVK